MSVKRIAVIYGCDSSEWEISCRSGEFVSSKIDGTKYAVYEIFARFGNWSLVAYRPVNSLRIVLPSDARPIVDKTDFSVCVAGEKVKFDFAYIMQHGTPGENGLVQGYLEMLNIPKSSCGSFVSAMTFDKYTCKNYLRDVDYVKCADDILIREGDSIEGLAQRAVCKLGLPMFVKPTDGGSSFGVTKVKNVADFDKAVADAFAEGKTVIVENAIEGRELACAVYFNGKEIVSMPVLEIVSQREFFDYDAKYNGLSKEICPADIPAETEQMIREVSAKIYARLGCAGCVRVDYILAETGLYFIEINTIPGMTSESIVPKMVGVAGLDMTDFLSTIIENTR